MSCGASGPSATDIITYIGIPLAVAGILPILYNTIATLVVLHRVKKTLKNSGLLTAAKIRSDVVNRIIELALPRYRLAIFAREDSRYWTPQGAPSIIPGGSWTALSWNINHIATKTQRFQYADEVKQPQAEADFEQLVWYLLDLGAVPIPEGWKVLQASGLWTAQDQPLMKSPDDGSDVLTVSSLDDSDGHLSLKLRWSASGMKARTSKSQPPHWVHLPGYLSPANERAIPPTNSGTTIVAGNGTPRISEKKQELRTTTDLDCELSGKGLVRVTANATSDPVINHLRIQAGLPDTVWFVSALAAQALAKQAITSYTIPDSVVEFAIRDTLPCGVLVLLGLIDESQAPAWSAGTTAPQWANESLRSENEQSLATRAGAQNPWESREDSMIDRNLMARRQLEEASSERRRHEKMRNDTRIQTAIESTAWDNESIARHSLHWLGSMERSSMKGISKLEIASGIVLHRMILDVAFASSVCRTLDRWKAWSANGGMTRSDLKALSEAQEVFAQAALLVGLIRAAATGAMGSTSADLHKCIEAHKIVRLG